MYELASQTSPLAPAVHCPLSTIHFLAIGFITPGFAVAGALLVSLPIIIHWLNRRRFKTINWAAMTFLLAAMKKNRRRLKFESFLLLAIRCLVIGLLGMALSRPMGCEDSSLAALAGKRAGLHVIVIDTSYSMAYEADRPDAKTHLDQAKKIAKRLVERLAAGGESVALVTAGRPALALISQPTYDIQAAMSAIDRVEQTYGGTDMPAAIAKATEIGRNETRQNEKYLDIISDCTRGGFDGPQAENLPAVAADAAKTFHVAVHDLAKASQNNAAVADVHASSGLTRMRFANDFVAELRGFGAVSDQTVLWTLDGTTLAASEAAVRPTSDGPDVTRADVQFKEGGPHVIGVAVSGGDRLKIDDARYRVVDVASELKVLIVEGERGLGALTGSGAFLQTALAPPADAVKNKGTTSYVAPELISELELGNKVFGDYRAIILAGVSAVPEAQAEQLKKFVNSGGALIVFMGEQVNPENYNKSLASRGLLPGPLVKRMSVATDQKSFLFDFKPQGLVHPLLRRFAKRENTGLDTAQIFTYYQVSPAADRGVARVLNFQPVGDQPADPAITQHTLGQGQVLFVATTANAEWTSLPAKPAYVALMHELLAGSVAGGERWMNLTVGQPLEVPASMQLTAAPTLKDSKQGDITIEQATTTDGQLVYRSPPLTHPGVYTLNTGGKKVPIAVNVPEVEADVRPLDPSALKKALGDIDFLSQADEVPPLISERDGNDYGWSIMTFVLTLAALECFLAMRFGHHRRK